MTKFKTYDFWVKILSALLLLLRIVFAEIGINFDSSLILDVATAVAGIMVVLGIISAPATVTKKDETLLTEITNKLNISNVPTDLTKEIEMDDNEANGTEADVQNEKSACIQSVTTNETKNKLSDNIQIDDQKELKTLKNIEKVSIFDKNIQKIGENTMQNENYTHIDTVIIDSNNVCGQTTIDESILPDEIETKVNFGEKQTEFGVDEFETEEPQEEYSDEFIQEEYSDEFINNIPKSRFSDEEESEEFGFEETIEKSADENQGEKCGTEANEVEKCETETNEDEKYENEKNQVEKCGTEANEVEKCGTEMNEVEKEGFALQDTAGQVEDEELQDTAEQVEAEQNLCPENQEKSCVEDDDCNELNSLLKQKITEFIQNNLEKLLEEIVAEIDK